MAEFINDPQETEFEAEAAKAEGQGTTQTTEIPEEFRNKTPEDLIRVIQDQKTFIGRQASEVGEVRKLADELIKRSLVQNQAPQKEEQPLDDADFLLNPKDTVAKLVANHPSVRQAQAAAMRMDALARKQALLDRHPDANDVVRDQEFQAWVKQSPTRVRKFMQAHSQYDAEAGDDLISTWKELRDARKVASEGAKNLREESNQTLREAAAVTGNAPSEGSKKILRRADLIKLQLTDPKRYQAMQDEILLAYAERRVK